MALLAGYSVVSVSLRPRPRCGSGVPAVVGAGPSVVSGGRVVVVGGGTVVLGGGASAGRRLSGRVASVAVVGGTDRGVAWSEMRGSESLTVGIRSSIDPGERPAS